MGLILHAAEQMTYRVDGSSMLNNSDGEVLSLVECYTVFLDKQSLWNIGNYKHILENITLWCQWLHSDLNVYMADFHIILIDT
jgi:DNA modification methylase